MVSDDSKQESRSVKYGNKARINTRHPEPQVMTGKPCAKIWNILPPF